MLKSMTGYGRCQLSDDEFDVTIEIKSVNHRYFDFTPKTPRGYGFLDEKLKSYVQSKVSRGKIECYVSVRSLKDDEIKIEINPALANEYVKAFKTLSSDCSVDYCLNTNILSRFDGVLTVTKAELDEDKIWKVVSSALDTALDNFIIMRIDEGKKLRQDVIDNCKYIIEMVDFIDNYSPKTVNEYYEKLKNKLFEVLNNTEIDESRILTEAAVYADKVAVAEETVRLRSHISQLYSFLESDDPVGKKMDFLVQEMNREANTIGSKAANIEIARKVIEIKSSIEKIREQIQNIE